MGLSATQSYGADIASANRAEWVGTPFDKWGWEYRGHRLALKVNDLGEPRVRIVSGPISASTANMRRGMTFGHLAGAVEYIDAQLDGNIAHRRRMQAQAEEAAKHVRSMSGSELAQRVEGLSGAQSPNARSRYLEEAGRRSQ